MINHIVWWYCCKNWRVLDVPTGFNLLGRVVRRIVVLYRWFRLISMIWLQHLFEVKAPGCYLNDNLFEELLETELKLLIFFLPIGRGQRELIYWWSTNWVKLQLVLIAVINQARLNVRKYRCACLLYICCSWQRQSSVLGIKKNFRNDITH